MVADGLPETYKAEMDALTPWRVFATPQWITERNLIQISAPLSVFHVQHISFYSALQGANSNFVGLYNRGEESRKSLVDS